MISYMEFIEQCKQNQPPENIYAEIHHIVPKKRGGTNDKDNLIFLTVKNHLLAHYLYLIEHPNDIDMFRAIKLFGCEEVQLYMFLNQCTMFDVPDELFKLCEKRKIQRTEKELEIKYGKKISVESETRDIHKVLRKKYLSIEDYSNKNSCTGMVAKYCIENNAIVSEKICKDIAGINNWKRTYDVLKDLPMYNQRKEV